MYIYLIYIYIFVFFFNFVYCVKKPKNTRGKAKAL